MYDYRVTLEMWELSHFVFTQEQHVVENFLHGHRQQICFTTFAKHIKNPEDFTHRVFYNKKA
ncbi:hypothetical protein LSS_20780 [Leptospira santarosai serovar Shermani str. LT 821]|uniref:Uncharacterized protein n=1 Tax=Leptospira santarosai serovar Shermani str. LT 821 TaxID=758847 RepID=A0A097ES97_9LEPT|nr:hypothetical protein LSS_20780 [Leptospira santarosai serovar Shermani str. LT 821]